MKGKIRVAIVTTVLVFSMFSIAVALLPPDQAQKVSVVFQGMTSVALLAVTATYVVFTRQLVQAQLDPTSALRIESEQRVVS